MLTIVDIVQRCVRILWVIDDKRTPQTVAVLSGQMRVIPEGSRLIGSSEVVQERVTRRDRALSHEGDTVVLIGRVLEQAMPVL